MAAPDIFTYITALAITLGLILLLWAGLAFTRARLMNMPLGGSLNTPKLKILETRFIDGRYKLCRATDGLRDYTLLLGPTEAEVLYNTETGRGRNEISALGGDNT